MTILLYDLATRDDRRPSPFCWRAKFALAHKGLAFETRPVGFRDIAALCGGAYKTVPIIEDGAKTVGDSWSIADYLDEAYPDRPRLFSAPSERGLCRFVDAWQFSVVVKDLFPMYVKDIHDHVQEEDRAYFRESREKGLGCTLEQASANREARRDRARESLEPIRRMLQVGQPFLAGGHAGYADYMVAGVLLWIASIATLPLLRADDPLLGWFDRVLDLYGGLGRATPRNALAV